MGQNTVAVNDSSFDNEVIKSNIPVLVDFWAPWCGPCVAIGPMLDTLAAQYNTKIKVAKMNVDENANVPSVYGVRSIPFLVMFKNGQVVDSVVGAVPKVKIEEMINKAL
ncbi:MAG: thioredoxin [Oligoflexales bacterium]|nr:thioredoxin [Oligoflexales bacterium]